MRAPVRSDTFSCFPANSRRGTKKSPGIGITCEAKLRSLFVIVRRSSLSRATSIDTHTTTHVTNLIFLAAQFLTAYLLSSRASSMYFPYLASLEPRRRRRVRLERLGQPPFDIKSNSLVRDEFFVGDCEFF